MRHFYVWGAWENFYTGKRIEAKTPIEAAVVYLANADTTKQHHICVWERQTDTPYNGQFYFKWNKTTNKFEQIFRVWEKHNDPIQYF